MARKSRNRRKGGKRVTVTIGKGGYLDKSKKGEVTSIGRALRYLGGLGGGAIAPYLGGSPAMGATSGRNLAAAMSKWLGYGAYKVNRNTVLTPETNIPMMHQSGQSIIVRHKEFVCDVVGGTGTPSDYTLMPPIFLNPGLSQSFPWLSSIARQYQEYTWRGVVYHFVSTSGQSVASTTTSLGNVMLHTDYRVTAPSPLNKAELLNEYFASDAKPSESFVHPIECDPKENPYNVQYVRTGAVPLGEDPKSYDLGKVNVATMGLPSPSLNVGELWVTYEVELRKPQIANFSGDEAFYKSSTGLDVTHPLGTVRTQIVDNIGLTVTPTTVSFPTGLVGTFIIGAFSSSAANQTTQYGVPTVVNCTILGTWGSGYEYFLSMPLTAAVGTAFLLFKVNLNNPTKRAVITFPMTAQSTANVDLFVTRVVQVAA